MAEQFYTILTKIGKAKIANSTALGTKVNFFKLQVGDSNGTYYNPTEDQTELKHKVWEGNINSISIDENNPNWIIIEVLLPSNVGGFMIREAAILDDEDNVVAIAKYPETYKPLTQDGSSKDILIRTILEVSNTSSVTLKIDPTVILATKKDIEIITSSMNELDKRITKNTESINNIKSDLADITTYQTAGGTANAISLNLPTLINGYATTFIVNKNNNKNATTINGKQLYKPNTTTAPNLVAGKAASIWYDSTKDCFFIKASAEGNAVAKDVLAGKIFSNDDDTGLVGTLNLSNLIPDNIKEGITINGVTGNLTISSLGGVKYARGTLQGDAVPSYPLGLNFKPDVILLKKNDFIDIWCYSKTTFQNLNTVEVSTYGSTELRYRYGGGGTIHLDGYSWEAWEKYEGR
ncbi:phage tail protein [Clostridium botulinum]|uniref:phage tail protein n=1 Tax=Clostridium botulinum TaxID=1491 RepID=UPI003DA38838